MMTCNEIEDRLTLYLYDELPAEGRAELDQHLAGCALCRQSLERLQQLHQLLSERRVAEASPQLLAWCREALDDAIDREVDRASWKHLIGKIFTGWSAIPATPGAWVLALVLLGFGLGWTLRPMAVNRPVTNEPVNSSNVSSADLGDFHINGISQVAPGAQQGEVNITVDAERRVTLNGSLDDPRIRSVLVDAMKGYDNAGIRQDTLEALGTQISEPSVRDALLYSVQHDPNVGVRLKALQLVRQMDWTPNVQGAVLETLEKDKNPGIRVAAIDVLSKHADDQVMPVLQQLASKDPNPYVRLKCISAVRKVDPNAF